LTDAENLDAPSFSRMEIDVDLYKRNGNYENDGTVLIPASSKCNFGDKRFAWEVITGAKTRSSW